MRQGDWIQTFSGGRFWPMDPHAEDVEIADIAHSLAMQCRFAGHCIRFYSVAEHCVHLSRAVAQDHALWALLHDASEAYLVDVPRPVKPFLNGYREAETMVMLAVCRRFGLAAEMPDAVKAMDWQILGDERANLSRCVVEWDNPPRPLGVDLQYWPPAQAEREFLARFHELWSARP